MADGQDSLTPEDAEATYEVPDNVPEYYIDSMHFATQLYTTLLYLDEVRPAKKPLLRLKIKVSPQMLKAMALLLGKQMRAYESGVGKIEIPKMILHQWGLEEEI